MPSRYGAYDYYLFKNLKRQLVISKLAATHYQCAALHLEGSKWTLLSAPSNLQNLKLIFIHLHWNAIAGD
jgi:hypothetical protein